MKKKINFLFLILMLFFMVSCAVNPVTGKKELMLFSEQAEINLGKRVDESLKEQYYFYNENGVQNYVKQIGLKLVPHTHRPHLEYHFSVLDTPVENAFAAPGGYIYITRGLLSMINSECELAVVLGHELGHVNARHSVKAFTKRIIFTAALTIGSMLSEDIRKIAPVIGIAGTLLFLKYSRSNEYEADSLGVLYARRAGYDPDGIVSFFSALSNLEEMRGGHTIPNFLSTHPLTEKRIEKAKALIKPEDKKLLKRSYAYLMKINGISYGKDPRNGFIKNNTFYHPKEGFSLKIPMDWKINHNAKKIILQSFKKDAAILITITDKKQNKDLKSYTEDAIAGFKNKTIEDYSSLNLNGFRAFNASFTTYPESQNSRPLWGMAVSIDNKKSVISTLMVSYKSKRWKYEPDFKRFLKKIKHSYRKAPRPLRIKVVKTKIGTTISNVFKKYKLNKKLYKDFLKINNLKKTDKTINKRYIKIIY